MQCRVKTLRNEMLILQAERERDTPSLPELRTCYLALLPVIQCRFSKLPDVPQSQPDLFILALIDFLGRDGGFHAVQHLPF